VNHSSKQNITYTLYFCGFTHAGCNYFISCKENDKEKVVKQTGQTGWLNQNDAKNTLKCLLKIQ
jgi:hypothetical protein